MKLSFADITPNRIKFNSHKNHNPNCDILELVISRDAFITYCVDINTGVESMEYYAGRNYVTNSTAKTYSAHYPAHAIPKKYRSVWNSLKGHYKQNYSN